MADIWSLGKIAMFVASGSANLDLKRLDEELDKDLSDMIKFCLRA